jgi:hypothetical protein
VGFRCPLFQSQKYLQSLKQKNEGAAEEVGWSLRGDKVRRNFTWMESFAEWVEYGKRHPDRKNQIPNDEGRLSSWVHEQRNMVLKYQLMHFSWTPHH